MKWSSLKITSNPDTASSLRHLKSVILCKSDYHLLLIICSISMNKWSSSWDYGYLSHRRPAKAQVSLRICAASPEPLLFAHIKYGSRRRVRLNIRHLALLVAAHTRLKNEFNEDGKFHNLMRWLKYWMTKWVFLHKPFEAIVKSTRSSIQTMKKHV